MATVTELLLPIEMDLDHLLKDLRVLIGAGHPILQAAAEHLFSAGGKRIRPGIVLLLSRALSPAKPLNMFIDEEKKYVVAVFDDEELPLAIGRNGQNIKLASDVTGYKIDAVKESEYNSAESG